MVVGTRRKGRNLPCIVHRHNINININILRPAHAQSSRLPLASPRPVQPTQSDPHTQPGPPGTRHGPTHRLSDTTTIAMSTDPEYSVCLLSNNGRVGRVSRMQTSLGRCAVSSLPPRENTRVTDQRGEDRIDRRPRSAVKAWTRRLPAPLEWRRVVALHYSRIASE